MNNTNILIYKNDWLVINNMYALKIVENKKHLKFYDLQDKKIVSNDKEEFIRIANNSIYGANEILISDVYEKYIKNYKFPITYNIVNNKINGYIKFSPLKAKYIVCSGKPSDKTCFSWEYDTIIEALDGLIDITKDKVEILE